MKESSLWFVKHDMLSPTLAKNMELKGINLLQMNITLSFWWLFFFAALKCT